MGAVEAEPRGCVTVALQRVSELHAHLMAREAVHHQQAEGGDPCPLPSPGETHLEIYIQCWHPQYKR